MTNNPTVGYITWDIDNNQPVSSPDQDLLDKIAREYAEYERWGNHNDGDDYTRCEHQAVDTGMLRSWCKWCNVDMEYDRTTGKYKTK